MIESLVAFFVKRGIQSRFAVPLVYLGIILTSVLLLYSAWSLWLHHHDKQVISGYENGVQAEINQEVSAASNSANAQDSTIANQNQENANQLQEDIHNAVTAHPQETRRPVGPASQSVLDRLRSRPR